MRYFVVIMLLAVPKAMPSLPPKLSDEPSEYSHSDHTVTGSVTWTSSIESAQWTTRTVLGSFYDDDSDDEACPEYTLVTTGKTQQVTQTDTHPAPDLDNFGPVLK